MADIDKLVKKVTALERVMMTRPSTSPAWPMTQVTLRKSMTPQMLRRQFMRTPSTQESLTTFPVGPLASTSSSGFGNSAWHSLSNSSIESLILPWMWNNWNNWRHTFNFMETIFAYTVKPVYNDHLWDQEKVVVVQRWSLFRGSSGQINIYN